MNTPKTNPMIGSGTIIDGTTKTEALFVALIDRLDSIGVKAPPTDLWGTRSRIMRAAAGVDTRINQDHLDGDFAWLVEVASDHLPPHHYVGMHPNDGADFGVWETADWATDGETIVVDSIRGEAYWAGDPHRVVSFDGDIWKEELIPVLERWQSEVGVYGPIVEVDYSGSIEHFWDGSRWVPVWEDVVVEPEPETAMAPNTSDLRGALTDLWARADEGRLEDNNGGLAINLNDWTAVHIMNDGEVGSHFEDDTHPDGWRWFTIGRANRETVQALRARNNAKRVGR